MLSSPTAASRSMAMTSAATSGLRDVTRVLVGLWGVPSVDAVVDVWAGIAGAISVAVPDQGRFPGPPCELLLALESAEEFVDITTAATKVRAWRVEPRHLIVSPSHTEVKMVSFVQRLDGLTHDEFANHWTDVHAPLVCVHHPGVADYTQNIVRESLTPGGAHIDGIAELCFRTRADFDKRFYDSDAGKATIRADVATFIGQSGISATLMRPVRR
jgi:uncharacterized protein (TIGR02118 family)